MSGPEELRALVEEMRAALAFYADPDSYRNRPLDEQRELLGGDDPTISVRGDFAANAPPGCALSDIQMGRRGHRARTALTRAESSLASPAGMEGWMPIETAPYQKIVDLWCIYGEEPEATYPTGKVVGFLVPRRHKTKEWGWFGNQSKNGVPQGYNPDLVPVAWRETTPDCPAELIAPALPAAPRGESE